MSHAYEPTHLCLFSGIGGFSLAAQWCGMRTVGFCEQDAEASLVLRHWFPGVPVEPDIKTLDGRRYFGVDLLTAGVPCQPTSHLGARRGVDDPRWLWPDTIRVVREARPRFVVLENPAAILDLDGGRAFNGIVSELHAGGYAHWWDVISVAAAGGGHLRKRLLVVLADSIGSGRETSGRSVAAPVVCPASKTDADCGRCDGERILLRPGREETPENIEADWQYQGFNLDLTDPYWFENQSPVAVFLPGIPNKLAEAAHRCIGNSVSPQVAAVVLQPIADVLRYWHQEESEVR